MKYRKRPVVVDAILWTGGTYSRLTEFCGQNWSRADVHEMSYEDDPEQVIVFNTKEQCWIPLRVGHWLIRGVCGELYPCAPDVFDQTYHEAYDEGYDRDRDNPLPTRS